MEGNFSESQPGELLAGMQIGPVYRLKVTEIQNHPGLEIFPTVEVIDRLYPPPGLALRFPIPIELTAEELDLAARGSFVTRVIYVEDPHTALPIAERADGEQRWVEAPQGEDPLVIADIRGRAVAILRIGSRVPDAESQAGFINCAPEAVIYDPADVCPQDPAMEEVHAIVLPREPQPTVTKAATLQAESAIPMKIEAAPKPRLTPVADTQAVSIQNSHVESSAKFATKANQNAPTAKVIPVVHKPRVSRANVSLSLER
jgi:hypothetical protein